MSTHFLPKSVPSNCHGLIRRAVEYWLSVHPADGLPGRHHLDPSAIRDLLPNVRFVEVKNALPGFGLDVVGRENRVFPDSAFAASRRREPFADFLDVPETSPFRAAVESGQPVWRRDAPAHPREGGRIAERVILPLSANGRDVHTLFVVHVDHEAV